MKIYTAVVYPALLLLFLLMPPIAFAQKPGFEADMPQAGKAGERGKVLKYSGKVYIVNRYGRKTRLSKPNVAVRQKDTIVTGGSSRVVLRFNDGTLTVLDEKSRLQVEQKNWFSYIGGKIYFTFRKLFGEPRRIQTRAATIGIRGTTLIVKSGEGGELVALKEGELQIDTTGPAFEIHRTKQADDFEHYRQEFNTAKQQTSNEFDQYRKQMQREFVEYKRRFQLKADQQIQFTGYRVDENVLDEINKNDFTAFEQEAGELIKQFREQ